MHFLSAKTGFTETEAQGVDLDQSPADIIFLSTADSDIALVARAYHHHLDDYGDAPSLRLASWQMLQHPASIDLYLEKTVQHAKLVIIRLLGGQEYWPYGLERMAELCRQKKIALICLPGDTRADPKLAAHSTLDDAALSVLHLYWNYGGLHNIVNFLRYALEACHFKTPPPLPPKPVPVAGFYWPSWEVVSENPDRIPRHPKKPLILLTFYRVWIQSENLVVIDQLIHSFRKVGLDVFPIFVTSLKTPEAFDLIDRVITQHSPDMICTTTGFALHQGKNDARPTIFAKSDAPLLHIILSSGTQSDWQKNKNGLSARDIAMHVALPEMDGRIIGRAVSFKHIEKHTPLLESDIISYRPVKERCRFMAELAARWCGLRKKTPQERRVAVILSNYPHRDSRLANGVGLDSPASVVTILKAMQETGYHIDQAPENAEQLMVALRKGPTNQYPHRGTSQAKLSAEAYEKYFNQLPKILQKSLLTRWGEMDRDPFFRKKAEPCFTLPIIHHGHIVIGLQPGRGYNIDPDQACHDPHLAPPHSYLAFYFWLRDVFKCDAFIHLGKHGTLEWLPGKAHALSSKCWPDVVLGSMPVLYPFIVNDPGEGAQAKRRTQSVIIDHLTPPLARAESHGIHAELENLLDEYYEASELDPKRTEWLRRHILDHADINGLLSDSAIDTKSDDALVALDGYLCTLKELQIRNGLHVFGQAPKEGDLNDLLLAMLRSTRGHDADQYSLLRALADDFNLNIDPLDYIAGKKWHSDIPQSLRPYSERGWHIAGDVVTSLELFALALLSGKTTLPPYCTKTQKIIEGSAISLRKNIKASAFYEIKYLLDGLAGRFVPAGPSGAPTRGRVDVLPTGRNFWSVDIRALPSIAAWDLGWKSASLLLEHHMQTHGDWPRHVALSAWGTSCMRTGGEDAAQMMALMGVSPSWENGSRRVIGFDILPLSVLARPRIDVTLRISGFFRDAFPGLIDLLDSAVRAVAALDEPEEENFLLASFKRDCIDKNPHAATRIFGPAPGAYGTGIQTYIDQSHWQHDSEIAESFLKWGGYGFGVQHKGTMMEGAFRNRVEKIDTIIHNQDNREHDILDSDDYYQFEGGMALATRHLSKRMAIMYHNDHSHPDSPKIGTLEQEIARIVRARAINPKWITSAMKHGYKGAFEMAATVDYLFAFAVTTPAVKPHHFDSVFDAYIRDDRVRRFIEDHNPNALCDMLKRFQEAQSRHVWRGRKNDTTHLIENYLKDVYQKHPSLHIKA